jgi:ABC-type transporter Mla MlaB component
MAAPVPTEISLALHGPLEPGDLSGLSQRLCHLIGPGVRTVFLDVSVARADALTVDALAQLQLLAKRRGCQVRLRGCSPALRDLVAFIGLTHVLPDD